MTAPSELWRVVWATRLNFITLFLWPKISLAMREVIEENHEEDEDIHQAGEENDAGYPVNNAFDEEAVEVGDDEENEAEATEEEVKNRASSNDAVSSCNVVLVVLVVLVAMVVLVARWCWSQYRC